MTDLPPARPGGPGMFSLGDADRLSELVAAAGFGDIRSRANPGGLAVSRLRDVLADAVGAERRPRPAPADAPEDERDRLAAAVREAVERFRSDDGYRAPGSALGVVATA